MVATALVALAACGDDEAGAPEVSGAWARTSPAAADLGALYFTVEADEDDQLTAVTVDPSVAARTEIHETVPAAMPGETTDGTTPTNGTMPTDGTTPAEGTMAGGMDGGAMTMQPIGALDLPADEPVALEPGGYHVMLLDLAAPLETGATFDATLVFAEADPVTVTVEVRDDAP
jgi:copper(I)-binding protein